MRKLFAEARVNLHWEPVVNLFALTMVAILCWAIGRLAIQGMHWYVPSPLVPILYSGVVGLAFSIAALAIGNFFSMRCGTGIASVASVGFSIAIGVTTQQSFSEIPFAFAVSVFLCLSTCGTFIVLQRLFDAHVTGRFLKTSIADYLLILASVAVAASLLSDYGRSADIELYASAIFNGFFVGLAVSCWHHSRGRIASSKSAAMWFACASIMIFLEGVVITGYWYNSRLLVLMDSFVGWCCVLFGFAVVQTVLLLSEQARLQGMSWFRATVRGQATARAEDSPTSGLAETESSGGGTKPGN